MKRSAICPFVGSIVDPDTARGYPTEQNCCFRAKPVSIISLDHQAHYCLTPDYQGCLAFQNKEGTPLPKEYIHRKARSFHFVNTIRSWRFLFVGLIIIIVLGLLAWLLISSGYLRLF